MSPESIRVGVLGPSFCSHFDAVTEVAKGTDLKEGGSCHALRVRPYRRTTITAEEAVDRLAAASSADKLLGLAFRQLYFCAIYLKVET